MNCPKYGNMYAREKVTNSELVSQGDRIRRRVCSKCGARFKTVEFVMDNSLRDFMERIGNGAGGTCSS